MYFLSAMILETLSKPGTVVYAQIHELVISEIMFNPDGDENAREFVEIYNRSNTVLSLEGFVIGDGEGFDTLIPAAASIWTVQPGAFALIMDPDYTDDPDPYDIPSGTPVFYVADRAIGSRGLSNSTAETVSLVSDSGDTLSQVTYSIDCPAGFSWERVIPESGDDTGNFKPSRITGGTPGQVNSVLPPAVNPALDDTSLVITPAHPVYGGSLDLALSFRNDGREPVSGVTVTIFLNGSESGNISFADPVQSGSRSSFSCFTLSPLPGGLITLTAIITSGNTEQSGDDSLFCTLSVPVPDGTVILSEVMAAPADGAPEWVELLNTGKHPVSLACLRIADAGGDTSATSVSLDFIDPNRYALLTAGTMSASPSMGTPVVRVEKFPALNNDGDTVRLLNQTSAIIDTMMYEETSPGISLELINPSYRGTIRGWDACTDQAGATPGKSNSLAWPDEEEKETPRPELTVTPNPFDDHTLIEYTLPFPLARVRLLVYDRKGRLAVKLRDSEESGSTWRSEWDGRSSDGDRLPAGPYVLSLEALDKQTGVVQTERTVIVIGARL